ncbi:hypothetical protein [Novispirillum itersonii]|uniref:Phage shock protein B n=1 Tax=Novispirillum itersonii TaxID=189 RepID=A0A7W9ZH82_NOVIT|nr:hypothetical protein [Novispirillum itersonii]MBB6211018.1 hypothetical protein [Novispirillum itersonii]
MGDGLSVQQVITGVLVPVVTAGFWILWHRISEATATAKTTAGELTAHKVDCERRFARAEDLERLEARIEARFDRLEEKLDRAIGRREEA